MLEIPENVREVLSALEAAGYEAWCVGGCVRDTLRGAEPQDWDVTTNARPEETMAVFGSAALPTGLKHGTVTVTVGGEHIEVTTYRVDGSYQDHRRPDFVTFTRSLTEDLRRRDFTVNAMAMDLRGDLQDPFGGQADLKCGILRCVGNPEERFEEDALRIMRGLRFGAVLGFAIEENTAAAIRKKRKLLEEIAVERIWVELEKLLRGREAAEILRQFPEVIGVFWPEILPMVGFDQQNCHHCYDVWEHTLHALAYTPGDSMTRCAMLLHDVGKPATFTLDERGVGHFYGHPAAGGKLADEMLRRLKTGTEYRERVVRLVEWHDRDVQRTEKGICRALNRLGEEDLRRLIDIKRGDNLGQAPEYRGRQAEIDLAEKILERVLEKQSCFSLKQLAVNGRDLMGLGLRGPEIGQTLEALLERVIDGELENRKEILLNWTKDDLI